MMFGQESGGPPIYPSIKYVEAERPPTKQELELWQKAEQRARRVTLLAQAVKYQFGNVLLIHQFAQAHQVPLNEPGMPDLEKRMLIALREIEKLKDHMCGVNQLDLGIRVSAGGKDLDIVQPDVETTMGWVIPAIAAGLIVVGIIGRWVELEYEIAEVTAQLNGVLKRSDIALCADPNSDTCKAWEHDKKTGGYYKRQTLVESIKSAASKVGTAAKQGLGAGLALAVPLLLWLYLPRKKG